MIVHAGKNGFLITSHDNQNDVTHTGREKGRGATAIVDDFGDRETAVDAIKSVVHQRHHERLEEILQEKSRDYVKFVTQDPVYEVQAYEFGNDDAHGILLRDVQDQELVVSLDGFFRDMQVMMPGDPLVNTTSTQAWEYMHKFLSTTVAEEDINRMALQLLDIFADDAQHSDVRLLASAILSKIDDED